MATFFLECAIQQWITEKGLAYTTDRGSSITCTCCALRGGWGFQLAHVYLDGITTYVPYDWRSDKGTFVNAAHPDFFERIEKILKDTHNRWLPYLSEYQRPIVWAKS